ncbi:MAG TPA: serine/threonine-protein kinase [Drouetiella sp.]
MPAKTFKKLELPKLTELPKFPKLTRKAKPEVNQREGRLTLLTSKLLESTEGNNNAAGFKWRVYAIGQLTNNTFKSMFAVIFVPFFLIFISSSWHDLSLISVWAALRPTFIFQALATVEVIALLSLFSSSYIAFINMLTSASAQAGQNPFPSSVYLQTEGFAFGNRNNLITWENVRAVKVRELLFMGMLRTGVLELYVNEGKVKFWRKLFNTFKVDGLKRSFYFFDPVTQKPVQDEYEGVCLRLPLIIFGFENEKQKFLAAIKKHVDPDSFDGDFEIESTAGDAASFTQLWLSELRSSNQGDLKRRLEIGHSLCEGRYIVEGVFGYGGFSVVYSARRIASETDEQSADFQSIQVAIKEIVLNSGGTRTSKENILKHIVSEVDLLKSLHHDNIVRCLDLFTEGGKIYVVLEAFEGKNLREHVENSGPLNEHRLAEVALQCCSILDYLHSRAKPVIHRDFTPDNLINTNDGIKLIDFNVAEEANANSSQTIVGKHAYLAPEQWCGQFTPSGDLYQLGCTLYFLATGSDPEPLTQSILTESIVQAQMSAVVRKLTAPHAEDRFVSAKELRETLLSMYPDLGTSCSSESSFPQSEG